jgi:nucleotide-binding universal stress UspA family protein
MGRDAGPTRRQGSETHVFNKILLAVDTSEQSHLATSKAAELAKGMNSEIHVFHVRPLLAGRGGWLDVDVTEEERNVADDVAAALEAEGLRVSASRIASYHGDTGKRIVDAAKEYGADVIVMGSRGHGELPSFLLGSVAHKVVHLADRPVLIVR